VTARLVLPVLLVTACSGTPTVAPQVVSVPDAGIPVARRVVPVDGGTGADAFTAAITDRPIEFDAEREALTLEYKRAHIDPQAADINITPTFIILHYTNGKALEDTWEYFNKPKLEPARKELAAGGLLNVSSHFLVDRDGRIVRIVPENRLARHTLGMNHLAIGVENVGNPPKVPLTAAQIQANAALVRHLAARYPITHLIGHMEVDLFEKTPFFVERDPKYRNRGKPDPGAAFLKAVRDKVADLKLSGPP
jgi:hypothetical protein